MPRVFLGVILFCETVALSAQNVRDLYYIVKKKAIEDGSLRIVYRDDQGAERPLKMCYDELKAEGLTLDAGVPIFHFERIAQSTYDSDPACISNNTALGRFEIDVKKKKIGDETRVATVPFRSFNWNASLNLYKLRFAQGNVPVDVLSDPASMLLSVTYGYTMGFARIDHESITHYYLTIGPFIGITKAELNSNTVSNPALLARDQNNVALSYGVTCVFGRNNFGLAISFGFDFSVGDNSSLWIYQHKPWVGLAVSTNLGSF